MLRFIIVLSFFLSFGSSLYSQVAVYSGGNGRGSNIATYLQSTPPGLNLFMGGNADGFALASYEEDLPTTAFNTFTGGNGDGFALSSYEESISVEELQYFGGVGDGFALMSYVEYDIGANIFMGGFGDGFALEVYEEDRPLGIDFFQGGNGDGFAFNSYEEDLPAIAFNMFTGGTGDGFAFNSFEEESVEESFQHFGGNGSGFGFMCYLQPDYITALPIELLSFQAQLINKSVRLDWKTASEINNDYFNVERSVDLLDWEIVSQVYGAGNSSEELSYSTYDNHPIKGVSYYRLKQVDFDGQFTYSMIRAINYKKVPVSKKESEVLIYPNPTTDHFNIQISGFNQDYVNIMIYNSRGEQVYGDSFELYDGNGVFGINRTMRMMVGFYIVVVEGEGNNKVSRKLMIQ